MEESFNWLFDEWLILKQESIKTKDNELYTFFLKEVNKTFSELFVKIEEEDQGTEFLAEILKLVSCEIKENSIKSKIDKIPF